MRSQSSLPLIDGTFRSCWFYFTIEKKISNLSESRAGEIVLVPLPEETITSHVEALRVAQSLVALALKYFKIPSHALPHAKHTLGKPSCSLLLEAYSLWIAGGSAFANQKAQPSSGPQRHPGKGRVPCFFLPFYVSSQRWHSSPGRSVFNMSFFLLQFMRIT